MQNYKKDFIRRLYLLLLLITSLRLHKRLQFMGIKGNGRKLLFIVNVFAASSKAGKLWSKAADILTYRRIAYHHRMTGKDGNAHDLTYEACEKGYRKFVAVGGDGTVHDVLNGILDFARQSSVQLSEFTLGVLPVGSGNDWIKSLGIPKDFDKAIQTIARGNTAKQDVVKVSILDRVSLPEEKPLSVSYMANIGGVGLDARVCETVNRKKEQGKRGKKLYISALLQHLFSRNRVRIRLECDGTDIFEGEYISIAFGIGRYSGGGMQQTPTAVLGDRLLDVTLIPELPMLKIAKEAPKLFTGRFHTVKELVQAKCRTVAVYPCGNTQDEPVEVDGEVVGLAPVRLEVLDDQLNIIIP